MKTEFHETKDGKLGYILYIPEDTKDVPFMTFLHGAGERGEKLDHVARWGVPRLIREGRKFNAVVLCPQCPADKVWDNLTVELKSLIDEIAERFSILPDRICLTGASMGGFGTFMMGMNYTNFFSAIAPVSGGGMMWRCSNLKNTPVYATHGDLDEAIPFTVSELMVERINECGGDAKYKLLKGYHHSDAIEEIYENSDVLEWLLSKRRTDFTPVPEFCSEIFD